MYLNIYICVCVCVCVCVFVCVHVFVYACMLMYVCMYICRGTAHPRNRNMHKTIQPFVHKLYEKLMASVLPMLEEPDKFDKFLNTQSIISF